jgi:hypothetical protein
MFFAVHKADRVRILLERAQITQVRMHRAFILALFDVSGEL